MKTTIKTFAFLLIYTFFYTCKQNEKQPAQVEASDNTRSDTFQTKFSPKKLFGKKWKEHYASTSYGHITWEFADGKKLMAYVPGVTKKIQFNYSLDSTKNPMWFDLENEKHQQAQGLIAFKNDTSFTIFYNKKNSRPTTTNATDSSYRMTFDQY
jgi:hypothetical protein